jgi:carbonic anhydrase
MKDKVASKVIRTAGNLMDDYALASIEYAVDRIGARPPYVYDRG